MLQEHEALQEKLQEVYEENKKLQLLTKNAHGDNSADSSFQEEPLPEGSNDNSLSEQLSSNAQTRALRLELENRRLQSAMDSLKESSFLESSNKILELEKENKKFSMKVLCNKKLPASFCLFNLTAKLINVSRLINFKKIWIVCNNRIQS